MDGTLVDTEPYWIQSEHELVAEHGDGSWSEAKGHLLVGHDLRDSARLIQHHGAVTLAVDDIVEYLLDGVIQRVRQQIPWRPGARELLADLVSHDVPNVLVTMSYRRFVDAVIPALPRGSFVAAVTGDEVANGKPHPEPYLTAAALVARDPSECVAIEDSPTGVRSAVAAGCRVIAVPNIVALPDDPSYRLAASLSELTAHTLWR
jgi:HAD superfamily hydrolase (TIGR01509 family)